jgi:hypothetical protein
MLDTPVPIRSLKLCNIGPGYYLDGRPRREFQVLLAPPPPPADRVQSFQTLFVSIKWLRPVSTTKKLKIQWFVDLFRAALFMFICLHLRWIVQINCNKQCLLWDWKESYLLPHCSRNQGKLSTLPAWMSL